MDNEKTLLQQFIMGILDELSTLDEVIFSSLFPVKTLDSQKCRASGLE